MFPSLSVQLGKKGKPARRCKFAADNLYPGTRNASNGFQSKKTASPEEKKSINNHESDTPHHHPLTDRIRLHERYSDGF